MARIKVIKPKKSIIDQAKETEQSVTCPACAAQVQVRLKVLLQQEFTCPKCRVNIPIVHR